ncbi:GNAT family N-acetyltransferase [Risungbinella massiliensis]|uniref:GNAT family N-acetyltransferase n=1 Tax=Risungbinella massiliensis TaxID=1329796 RepID=UPI0005CC26B0|nr:GNAT family N-acetyltransferase [Risungbinella massiliensis]
MKIQMVLEHEISNELTVNIQTLLAECFLDSYPKRTYFKQIPHFRFLTFNEENCLVGQVGLDYRVMNLNGNPVRVLGVIDLCVSQNFRSKGLGSLLLSEIEMFCEERNVDFLLLFAGNKSLYLRNGYKSVKNKCKWLKIDEKNQTTFGIGHKVMDELMMKEIGQISWNEGDLDFLGYLY